MTTIDSHFNNNFNNFNSLSFPFPSLHSNSIPNLNSNSNIFSNQHFNTLPTNSSPTSSTSTSSNSIELFLITLIEYYLKYFNYSNALFYAEKLFYFNSFSLFNLFLLSKCFYYLKKYKQVYFLLKSSFNSFSFNHSNSSNSSKNSLNSNNYELSNRYLFSLVCYHLKKYSECEEILLPFNNFNPKLMTSNDLNLIPGGSNGLYLLGLICRKEQRKDYAIDYFIKCLEYDNLNWNAFHELCEMGVEININKMFSMTLNNATEFIQLFHQNTSNFSSSTSPHSTANINLNPNSKTFHSKLNENKNQNNINNKNNNNNNKLQSKIKINSQPTLMEKRKSVEQIRDYRSSPSAATSLGLSSCAVRIGFATPGGMPSLSSPSINSMSALNIDQMSLISNTHPMTYPQTGTNSITDNSMNNTNNNNNTPLQIPNNPLQYLLQSRYRTASRPSQLHHIDEIKSNETSLNQMTPTPQITKHLFPLTTDQTMVMTNTNTMTMTTTTSEIRPIKAQLFETPNIGDEGFELNRGREINFREMDTPGLTPIERNTRDVDVDDGNDDIIIRNDHSHDFNDNLSLYGPMTEKRGEKSDYTLDEDDISIDLRQNPQTRDEVRRRVSFGPMIDDKQDGILLSFFLL